VKSCRRFWAIFNNNRVTVALGTSRPRPQPPALPAAAEIQQLRHRSFLSKPPEPSENIEESNSLPNATRYWDKFIQKDQRFKAMDGNDNN
jgi:hypothetical protein